MSTLDTISFLKSRLTQLLPIIAVRTDAIDPDMTPGDFSRRLQQMGVAQPNPTYSPSSTASNHLSPEASIAPAGPLFPSAKHNATLSVLECRRELQQRADDELKAIGRGSPRRFINIRTLVDAFQLLKRGVPAIDIEKRFNLEPGLLSKLGRPSILSHQSSGN